MANPPDRLEEAGFPHPQWYTCLKPLSQPMCSRSEDTTIFAKPSAFRLNIIHLYCDREDLSNLLRMDMVLEWFWKFVIRFGCLRGPESMN